MEKENKVIPFLIGLFFGWFGVGIVTHLIYMGTILTLIALLVFKK